MADDAGNVACCPAGAVCTGVVNGVITEGTVDSDGQLVSATASSGGAVVAGGGSGGQVVTSVGSSYVVSGSGSAGAGGVGAGGGLVAASSPSSFGLAAGASSGGGFIVDGGSTVATPGFAVRGAEVVSISPNNGPSLQRRNADVRYSRSLRRSLFGCWRWFLYERSFFWVERDWDGVVEALG